MPSLLVRSFFVENCSGVYCLWYVMTRGTQNYVIFAIEAVSGSSRFRDLAS